VMNLGSRIISSILPHVCLCVQNVPNILIFELCLHVIGYHVLYFVVVLMLNAVRQLEFYIIINISTRCQS